ncbi:MAG: helix-turn-helix transcriptional regulator [Rhodoblastus sp.]|nr:MAG: helix-turn-helix transcriptional regulator [Rhodoblastus sp.]
MGPSRIFMRDDTEITGGGEKRPRGRPRGFCRDAALAAIGEVFARKGFAETTLDDLGAATGLTRPSLYAAFGDKEAAYLAALAHYGESAAARTGQALARPGRLVGRLSGLFAEAAAFSAATPRSPAA